MDCSTDDTNTMDCSIDCMMARLCLGDCGFYGTAESRGLCSKCCRKDNSPAVVVKNGRCVLCKKKVGLLGFDCRCGHTFCGTHRYPEAHACGFDFKKAGRILIQIQNPVVKADKIVDRI